MANINHLKEKYIELLLKRGVNFNKSNSLFISFNDYTADFANEVALKAKKMGIKDVYLYNEQINEMHDILKKINIEDIEKHPFFNKSIWDYYAHKNASFIVLRTFVPSLMSDVDSKALAKAANVDKLTRAYYKKRQLAFDIPWCFAPVPNEVWAKQLFPNDKNAYEKLFLKICDACMIDDNVIKNWDIFLKNSLITLEKLNDLEIKHFHYTSELGTDFKVELTNNTFWSNVNKLGDNFIPNIPSYENFTNPNMWSTNGIIRNSRPLSINGKMVDDFFLQFKDGKIINYDAKEGKELLDGLFESNKYMSYLGEVAIVEKDSPVAKTNLVYNQTTLDENAGCHVGIGSGMIGCVLNGSLMNEEELLKNGINPSKNHVDIVFGTNKTSIEAETNKGKVLIFKNGKYNI